MSCCSILLKQYFQILHESASADWQLYLQAGVSIVNSWIERHYDPIRPCQPDSERELDASATESVRGFLVGSIVRFDVLSSLTKDSAPALSKKYQNLLKTRSCGIPMETVLGCPNWLLNTLLDLYLLRDWKKDTKTTGTLSLRELIRRAQPIKENLESAISHNLEELNKHKQELECRNSDNIDLHLDYDISVVTHIFACAVSVFLEVIVSGALPKLPEIRNEVRRALESYAYINDSDLLNVLRWPLCITGSVAEPDQYDFFRALLSSPNVARIEAFRQSLELLEECWRMNAGVINTEAGFELTQVQRLTSWNYMIA